MVDPADIRQGLEVYGDNNQAFGTVERVEGQNVYIGGQSYPLNAFSRFENNRLYLAGNQSSLDLDQGQGELKVPVYEEQLNVGKRQVELGEVELQKTVTQEQVSVPVELRREEVHVQEVDVPDRPVQPGEATFQEGTIRVPVRGEEAVVAKQAVVTGEVVVNKGVVAEKQQISDTVRKEQVTVDKNYTETQQPVVRQESNVAPVEGYYTDTAATTAQAQTGATTYATDSAAGSTGYDQSQIQEGMEVYSADNERLGKVKEVSGGFFLVGRGLFSSDIEASFDSVQTVQDNAIILNLTKAQVEALT